MYRFTRGWGGITAGVGWLILVATPIVTTLAAITQSAALKVPVNQFLVVATALGAGLVVGVLVGGVLIVAGQSLRIAVDSVNIQAAMLEELRELSVTARSGDPAGDRFSGLAREE